ncbi:MAG: hypothetical protein OXE81_11485 [Gammaproteobacteria bacterium]|nr:hypothetical protein [Gammaproteobacteria bacterium]
MTLLTSESESDAIEHLHRLGCTDGLPVVVPTPERVTRMVLACGLEGHLHLGDMGPAGGAATVEKVAVAAVMAGCLPDYAPIVLAGVRAVLDARFDLTEMQATTHCTAPLMIVNGPAREAHGPVASGFGALGPGFRANAAIGRALRLAMINVGGGKAGVSDMALLGHPGKFTYCLAEDEENSPFESLAVSLGYGEETSIVTVVGAEAPQSVIFAPDADRNDNSEALLQLLAAGFARPGTNNSVLRGGAGIVVLNPDHARELASGGFGRKEICQRLFDLCDAPSLQSSSFAAIAGDAPKKCFHSPEDIIVFVAGGGGLYSMIMPTWCAGPHRNSAVSQIIELNQACEMPA